jgi:hypothetical protein
VSGSDCEYRYQLTQKGHKTIAVDVIVRDGLLCMDSPQDSLPRWVDLEFAKCPGCPLTNEQYCPAAMALNYTVMQFVDSVSHDQAELSVTTPERSYQSECTMQSALGSLMGLVLPFSGCPHTAFFKPMARMHLPLASENETVFRACATFFLSHYFKGDSKPVSLEGLNQVYEQLHEVNQGLANRVRKAGEGDSAVNAIVLLDCFTRSVPYFVKKSLVNIESWFNT